MLWQTRQIKILFNNKDKKTNRSKVVYKGDCTCGVDYIGETVRNLAVRIAEHSNLLILLKLQNTCVKTHHIFSLGALSLQQKHSINVGWSIRANDPTIPPQSEQTSYFLCFQTFPNGNYIRYICMDARGRSFLTLMMANSRKSLVLTF